MTMMDTIYPFHSPAIDNASTLSSILVTTMAIDHDENLIGRRSIMRLPPSWSTSNLMSSDSTISTEGEDFLSDITDEDNLSDITDEDYMSDVVDFLNNDGDDNTTYLGEKTRTTVTSILRQVEEDKLSTAGIPRTTCSIRSQTISVHDRILARKDERVFRSVPLGTNNTAPNDRKYRRIHSYDVDRNEPCRVKSGCAMPADPSLFFSHTMPSPGDDVLLIKRKPQSFLGRAVSQIIRSFSSRQSIKLTSSMATDESTLVGELL